MIEINNCTKKYKNRILFKNVNLILPDTGCYLLNGLSGHGKTTLLKMICGMDSHYEGSIITNSEIIYLPQEDISVKNILFKDAISLCPNGIDKEKIEYYLDKLKISHLLNTKLDKVSVGEYKRILLFFAIISFNQIILIDEPTASLDDESREIYISIIKEISKNKLVIIATHDNDYFNHYDGIIKIDNCNIFMEHYNDNSTMINSDMYFNKNNKDIPFLLKKIFKNANLIISSIILFILSFCLAISGSITSTKNSFYLEESLKQSNASFYSAVSMDGKGFYKSYSNFLYNDYGIKSYFKFETYLFPGFFAESKIKYIYFSSLLNNNQIMVNEECENEFPDYNKIINNKLLKNEAIFPISKLDNIFDEFKFDAIIYKDASMEKHNLLIEFKDFDDDRYNIYISDLIDTTNDEISFYNQVTNVQIPFTNGIRSPNGEFEILVKKEKINNKIIISNKIKNDFIFYMFNMGIYIESDNLHDLSKIFVDSNIYSNDDFYQNYYLIYLEMINELKSLINIFIIVFIFGFLFSLIYYLYSFYCLYINYSNFLLTIGFRVEKYKKMASGLHIFFFLFHFVIICGITALMYYTNMIKKILFFNIFDINIFYVFIGLIVFIPSLLSLILNNVIFKNFDYMIKRIK